jgi:hypothetical protein
MQRSATFSRCGKYRYSLTRSWSDGPTTAFVMLNPSTADAEHDDPTIRKCIGFAQRWGFGHMIAVNLFAFRAVSPFEMMKVRQPIGPGNKAAIEQALTEAGAVICAWGVYGRHRNRDQEFVQWIDKRLGIELMCLGVTNAGHPRHPLYVSYATELRRFCLTLRPACHLSLRSE